MVVFEWHNWLECCQCVIHVDYSMQCLKKLVQQYIIRKQNSGQSECRRPSGRAMPELSQSPRWRITLALSTIWCITLLITYQSQHNSIFWLCQSPTWSEHSGLLANIDHMSEWAHWVCILLATGPVLDPAGYIGLRGHGLTASKIDDFLSEPSL
jgi:hypothetical protein